MSNWYWQESTVITTKVGDNWSRIEEALRLGLERSDASLFVVGCPTQDETTRDVIEKCQLEPAFDEAIEDELLYMLVAEGATCQKTTSPGNGPEGAHTIEQQPGTAPGLVVPVAVSGATTKIYAVPRSLRNERNGAGDHLAGLTTSLRCHLGHREQSLENMGSK